MSADNRFQAILQTVRAGDDQARRDAEQARARRAHHWFNWWYGTPTRDTDPSATPRGAQSDAQERAA